MRRPVLSSPRESPGPLCGVLASSPPSHLQHASTALAFSASNPHNSEPRWPPPPSPGITFSPSLGFCLSPHPPSAATATMVSQQTHSKPDLWVPSDHTSPLSCPRQVSGAPCWWPDPHTPLPLCAVGGPWGRRPHPGRAGRSRAQEWCSAPDPGAETCGSWGLSRGRFLGSSRILVLEIKMGRGSGKRGTPGF